MGRWDPGFPVCWYQSTNRLSAAASRPRFAVCPNSEYRIPNIQVPSRIGDEMPGIPKSTQAVRTAKRHASRMRLISELVSYEN
jgi:hypothetical protein